ncbi:hypothetical protein CAEBREN_18915 [Caenorhabditis brenneri]|uniref:Uncharacterized protein n=1 Tax=Caenorhabditis brenneri TaxID=135651 RepID=G0N7S5_CAEBE|nr:hypothetical protein CAEBREN_18915 [Caenorhabditis brenneri]
MPPAGCNVGAFNEEGMLQEYEPQALSQDEVESRRAQDIAIRLFHQTFHQMRLLAEEIQAGLEYTARIQEEHRQIKRAMARQRRLNRRRRKMMEESEGHRINVIKAFFSCRERREAFPDLAKQYFQSIS